MKELNKNRLISYIVIVAATIVLMPLMSFVYGKTQGEIIRNTVFSIFFALGLLYFLVYSTVSNKLEYDNFDHPRRFMVTYIAALILCVLFPLVDVKGWIFLSTAIAISLFSNTFIGFFATNGLILMAVLLSNSGSLIAVCVYVLTSFIGILLFQDIDQSFKVGSSIFLSVLILSTVEIAGFVMLENAELSAEQFIMPIVNVAINSIVLFFILKYFNSFVANKYRNKYLELNDQEYKELIKLKEVSKTEYYRSIHTAYLAERMANAIGCDVNDAKNCAYYHRIKKAFEFSEGDCERFVIENEFPPNARKLLLSFLDKNSHLVSKEAGIVYLSDKFISSLMSLFEKDKKVVINYENLVDTLFEKNFVKETLADSELTQKDFRIIKEIILKETLYYDFLR